MKFLLLSFSLFLTAGTFAQTDKSVALDSIIKSYVNDSTPGLFVGIVQNGTIVYEGYAGLANLQHNVAANKNTRCNIASTAKQFVALMALDLEMKGKLSLEDDIRTYLPKLYPNVTDKIKIKHLITHTSGVRDYCDLMSIQGDPWWRREGLDNDDVLEMFEEQKDLGDIPGSQYRYSNTGYILLAKIIEKITDTEFTDYSTAFFQNLGMNNTVFMDNYMAVMPNLASPYNDWGDGKWQQWPTLVDVHGDGALFTTLHDQLVYEIAVQKAVAEKNTLLIKSQSEVPNTGISKYGFGLELGNKFGFRSVFHAGGTGAYSSQMYRFPDEQLTVFVMSNNGTVWTDGVARKAARMFLPKKERKPNYPEEIANNPSFQSKDALGYYQSPDGYIICIEEEGEIIQWRNATYNPYPLSEEKAGIYTFDINSRLKAIFASDRVVYSTGAGIEEEYFRMENTPLSTNDLEQLTGKYKSEELGTEYEMFLEEGKLMVRSEEDDDAEEIEIVNKNHLMVSGNFMTIERDALDRTVSIRLTANRAANVRFKKITELKTNSRIETNFGSIGVTTVYAQDGHSSQILITANESNGNELWSKQYGGKSFDKASAIIETEDGYLIIGSTSSYGVGNYDVIVLQIDAKGKKLWQKTYGKQMNDYGYALEATASGFVVKGTTQHCQNSDDSLNTPCDTNVWWVEIDKQGNQLSENVLEPIVN